MGAVGQGRKNSCDRADARTGLRRISIVGSSGSGKSWLARRLSDQLAVPLHHLDALRRRDGSLLPADEFRRRVEGLALQERWIIDGHYRDVRDLVWQRAEAIVWLNYPLSFVAGRLLLRFWRNGVRGLMRSHRTKGATLSMHSAPPAVSASWRQRLARLARSLAERREYGELLRAPEYAHVAVFELTSAPRTAEWLASLGDGASAPAWHAPPGGGASRRRGAS